MRRILFLLILAFIALMLAGCTNDPLAPLDTALDQIMGYGSVDAQFCTSAPSPGQQKTKYLFILDHSASNKPGLPAPICGAGNVLVTNVDPNACWALCGNMTTQATDPSSGQCVTFTPPITNADANGYRRYGPMINFIQNLTPDPNNPTYFAMIDFNNSAALAQGMSGFDNSASDFVTNYADPDWIGSGTATIPSPVDGGFTDYDSALGLAYQVIYDDATLEAATGSNPPVLSQYVIVFVTDGEPTIATPNGPNPTCTESFTGAGCGSNSLKNDISAIMGLKTQPVVGSFISGITLNTAYYFNSQSDSFAQTLLQQMATAGDGQYIQFASGATVLYQQFAPPARQIVNQLAAVYVQNQNGVWWENGEFMTDSDGDGLPDSIEQQFGSNPNSVDSDGNGVSDYIEWRTKGKPCNDPHCLPANRDPYAICAGYSPVTAPNGSVTFSSSSNDGLNDCEKFVLGGVVGEFNSNNDLIPDFYASVNGLPIIPGSSGTVQDDPFGDGISNLAKLLDGLPLQISDKSLINVQTRSTSLAVVSQPTPETTCYHLQVSNIALSAAPQNNIKIMLVQNLATLQNQPFLMTAIKPVNGSGVASFQSTDFH